MVIKVLLVDSKTPIVTSSISRFAGLTQFFGGTRRDRVYVRAFIYVSVCVYNWVSKKNGLQREVVKSFAKFNPFISSKIFPCMLFNKKRICTFISYV